MVDEKRAAEWRLEEILMAMSEHRGELAAYSDKGDASGVARCDRALEFNYSRIRKHCTRNDLELPHDVPDEGA